MANPTAWVLEAETETDRLQMALAQAEADLQRHSAALSKLQSELMASRLEVAGARGEIVQFRGMLHRAEAALARVASLEADAISRDAEIRRLQAETLTLRTSIDVLHASLSWRISAPVRVVGRLIRGIVGTRPDLRHVIRRSVARLRRAGSAVNPPPAPLPAPADPNARFIFQAAPLAGQLPAAAEGVVTLDMLYQLSRSL